MKTLKNFVDRTNVKSYMNKEWGIVSIKLIDPLTAKEKELLAILNKEAIKILNEDKRITRKTV